MFQSCRAVDWVCMQCGCVVAETGVCRDDVQGVNEPPGIQRVLCVRCKWKKSPMQGGGLAGGLACVGCGVLAFVTGVLRNPFV